MRKKHRYFAQPLPNVECQFKKMKSGVPGIGPEFRVAVIKEQQQNTSKSE
jgi:hypothetical protein